MQLKLVGEYIDQYKNSLRSRPPERLFLFESLLIWQQNFSLDTSEPAAMFERSLENSQTRRLWQTDQFFPKKMMLEFWRLDPMTTRLAFADLLDETRPAENRLSRFAFACDMLLTDFRDANPLTRQTEHFHGDGRLASIYLSFQYPASYAPYDFEVFKTMLARLGSRDIPENHDPARWFKIARTIQQLLMKDNELIVVFNKWIQPKKHFTGESLLMADDFSRFVVR